MLLSACDEFVSCAAEEFVLIEAAIQFAIQQVKPLRGLETDAFEGFLIGRQDPSRGSSELKLKAFAYILIEPQHIFVA